MNVPGQIIPEDECALNFLTCELQLRKKPGKRLKQEIDPTGDLTRARWMRDNDVISRLQRWSTLFSIYLLYNADVVCFSNISIVLSWLASFLFRDVSTSIVVSRARISMHYQILKHACIHALSHG